MTIRVIILLFFLQDIQGLGRETVKGTRCIFPFMSRGNKYTDCAPGVNQPYPWCAISLTYYDDGPKVKDWEICTPVQGVEDEVKMDQGIDRVVCKSLCEESCKDLEIMKLCPQMCSKDEELCKSFNQEDCKNNYIMDQCPKMCSKGVDKELCKSFNKEGCKYNYIMDRCPQMCPKDKEVCKSFNQDSCKNDYIMDRCPQMCLKGLDEEFCKSINQGNCKEKYVMDRCPQMCSKETCQIKNCTANSYCIEGKGHETASCNCKSGFRKDGNLCIETCQIKNCTANTACIEGRGQDAASCNCKSGFRKAGNLCLETCQIKNCTANAACIEGIGQGAASCNCKSGFRKDGDLCKACLGDEQFLVGNQCFRTFRDKTRRFEDANSKCLSESLILAEPIDGTAANRLRKMVVERFGNHQSWIGARGDGSQLVFQHSGRVLLKDSPYLDDGRGGSMATSYCLELDAWSDELKDNPGSPYDVVRCTDSLWAMCEVL